LDANFWHQRWANGQIGFHQSTTHALLERWWPELAVPAGAAVYVPFCGKTLDMVWLAGLGHSVVGSELSALAVAAFFAEQALQPAVVAAGAYTRHVAPPFEILEGDALALTAADLGPVVASYDRAALVALPPGMRPRYAAHHAGLMPPGSRTLLISFEYPQERYEGPPFAVTRAEVQALYSPWFEVRELERVDVLAENPKFAQHGVGELLEVAYALVRTNRTPGTTRTTRTFRTPGTGP